MEKQAVPIWEKANLTIEEAAAYFGIGTMRSLLRFFSFSRKSPTAIFSAVSLPHPRENRYLSSLRK